MGRKRALPTTDPALPNDPAPSGDSGLTPPDPAVAPDAFAPNPQAQSGVDPQ